MFHVAVRVNEKNVSRETFSEYYSNTYRVETLERSKNGCKRS